MQTLIALYRFILLHNILHGIERKMVNSNYEYEDNYDNNTMNMNSTFNIIPTILF